MRGSSLVLQAAVIAIAAMAFSGGARATDAAHAWGTVSVPGQVLLDSAETHFEEGQAAQTLSQGPNFGNTSGFPAVTSCGTCTTITIQGNNDSINGNSISSTNSGTVTSNGTFSGTFNQ